MRVKEKSQQLLKRLKQSHSPAQPIPTHKSERSFTLQMTDNQKRIWLHEQHSPNKILYGMPLALSFNHLFDIMHLQKALDQLIKQHESLRTTFSVEGDEFQQTIHPKLSVTIGQISIASNFDENVRKYIQEALNEQFDFKTGPLLRISYYHNNKSKSALFIYFHHIISDGQSFVIFTKELFNYYQQLSKQQELSSHTTFQDSIETYLKAQQAFHRSTAFSSQKNYWQKKLENLPTLRLIPDELRPSIRSYAAGKLRVTVPNSAMHSVEIVLQNYGATVFEWCFCVYGILLSRCANQDDFSIGVVHLNRDLPEIAQGIGFYANTLPHRFQLHKQETALHVLNKTCQTLNELYQNHTISFEDIAKACKLRRTPGQSTLIQTLFVMQNFSLRQIINSYGHECEYIDINTGIALFDLNFSVSQLDDAYCFTLDYNKDLFSEAYAEHFLNNYTSLLTSLPQDLLKNIEEVHHTIQLEAVAQPSQIDNIQKSKKPHSGSLESEKFKEILDNCILIFSDIFNLTLPKETESSLAEIELFNAGGDSVHAIRIASRINQLYQIELTIQKIFELQSPQKLAQEIFHQIQSNLSSALPKIEKQQNLSVVALSGSLKKMWVLQTMMPNNLAYQLFARIALTGPLSIDRFKKVFQCLAERHDAFLLGINVQRNGHAELVLQKQSQIPLEIIDLTQHPIDEAQSHFERIQMQFRKKPLEFQDNNPMFKCTMVRLSEESHHLLITAHHILFDAWSFLIWINEFKQAYLHHDLAHWSIEHSIPIRYIDFIAWENTLPNTLLESHQLFWQKQLDAMAPINLPYDYPVEPWTTYKNETIFFELDAQIAEKAYSYCIVNGITINDFFCAVYAISLSFFCSTREVLFGIPSSYRQLTGLESVIGNFVKVLPMKFSIEPTVTLQTLLQRMRNQLNDCQQHWLGDSPILDKAATMIKAVFGYIHMPNTVLSINDIEADLDIPRPENCKYDLVMTTEKRSNTLSIVLEYNAEAFRPETMKTFISLFLQHLKLWILDDKISVDTAFENSFNHLSKRSPPNSTNTKLEPPDLFTVFSKIAEESQKKAAILTSDGNSISYTDLLEQSLTLAKVLQTKVMPTSERVLLYFEDPIKAITAALACLAAGKVYVPVSSQNPTARLKNILVFAEATCILTDTDFDPSIFSIALQVIKFSEAFSKPVSDIMLQPHTQKLAYILFTSGSTGKPKGVIQSKANVLAHTNNFQSSLSLKPTDVIAQFADYAFDAGLMDYFAALLSGATVLIQDLAKVGLHVCLRAITQTNASIMHLTPTVFRSLLTASNAPENFNSVRIIVFGGEAVLASDLALYQKYFPDACLLLNNYGPSECTLALQGKFNKQSQANYASLDIGQPVSGCTIRLVDDNGYCSGLRGQLQIASENLCLGYWANTHETDSVFYKNKMGTRCYMTGDIVTLLPDGNFLFISRRHNLPKINGISVSLDEIKNIMLSHPHVIHAAIEIDNQNNSNVTLAAYYQHSQDVAITVDEMRTYLLSHLPKNMVPHKLSIVESFTMTQTGKLQYTSHDKSKLEVMEPSHQQESTLFKCLQEIWATELQTTTLDPSKSFFDWGASSLNLLNVHAAIEQQLKFNIPLIDLFQYTTLEALSKHLEQNQLHPEPV